MKNNVGPEFCTHNSRENTPVVVLRPRHVTLRPSPSLPHRSRVDPVVGHPITDATSRSTQRDDIVCRIILYCFIVRRLFYRFRPCHVNDNRFGFISFYPLAEYNIIQRYNDVRLLVRATCDRAAADTSRSDRFHGLAFACVFHTKPYEYRYAREL